MSWYEWLVKYSGAIIGISLVAFFVGLLAMRYVVIYLPADYFVRRVRRSQWWFDQHPAVRWTLVVLKNAAGWLLIVGGAVLSLPAVPGPGVLLVLLGLSLVNFPGKRQAEVWLLSLPDIHRRIDHLRAKHGKKPLQLPVEHR